MGDFLDDDSVFRAFNDRRLNADSRTPSYGSVGLLVAAGLYACLKALELLGYPVWWWFYMALERAKGIASRDASSADAPSTDGDTTMPNGGSILSRTFGLNGTSLLQKGVRGVAGALSKGPSEVPPGLGNWDNSCYQNSVIQGMASLPSLRAYLAKATAEYGNLDIESTNGALFDMVSKLNDPRHHGQNFWIKGKLKSMSTFQQQDAQEYYSKILDALEKEVQQEVKKRKPSDAWADAAKVAANAAAKSQAQIPEEAVSSDQSPSREMDDATPSEQPKIIPNPLDGLLAQRVGCIRCGYVEGLQLIPFNCITVSLGRNSAYDIRECLDDYTHLEQIEGVECAKCTLLKNKAALAPLADRAPAYAERLQAVENALENDDFDDKTLVKNFKILKKNWTQSVKSRQAVIARAPKALVLHVNRSIFDEMTGAMYKNSANVSYPRKFDLGNWCLGSDLAGGEWPRDPTKSMLGDAKAEPTTDSPFQYRLRAAVTHYGSHGNGHYVCYRPHAQTPAVERDTEQEEVATTGEQWWRFSDESVYPISEAQAHQGNIFMLFYERIDDETPNRDNVKEATRSTIALDNNIPLPPGGINLSRTLGDDAAAMIPLPDDDDLLNDQTVHPTGEELAAPGGTAPRIETGDGAGNLVVSPNDCGEPTTVGRPSPEVSQSIVKVAHVAAPASTTNRVRIPTSSNTDVAYPTPPPESPSATIFDDTETSEAGSDDAPSTLLTSDDEPDISTSKTNIKPPRSPHLMRTAGESPNRDGGSRTSLPMVTA
ncbi:cysteine proteinase [Paraphaeosphaeria sporulosa]|uniref:ubiquitinyl hydrolase 1 n=1 Tax=Paraphaeosphaeria sporulosa TaxID=1460663 RepID=A0A177C6T1_9PLEO|nr:cysteine proteinase [Paraphaeosphaeria sporulosa]OAG02831.1 cysteine proteinase [Paraphaeosphaeria sporulosa]